MEETHEKAQHMLGLFISYGQRVLNKRNETKKSPPPNVSGDGRHQNTLHFKTNILSVGRSPQSISGCGGILAGCDEVMVYIVACVVEGVVVVEHGIAEHAFVQLVAREMENCAAFHEGFVGGKHTVRKVGFCPTIHAVIEHGSTIIAFVFGECAIQERRVAKAIRPAVIVNRPAVEVTNVVLEVAIGQYWAGFSALSIVVNGTAVFGKIINESAVGDCWIALALRSAFVVKAAAGALTCGVGAIAVGVSATNNEAVQNSGRTCIPCKKDVVGIVIGVFAADVSAEDGGMLQETALRSSFFVASETAVKGHAVWNFE